MLDKLLVNGTIVTGDYRYKGNIGITGGIISHILAPGVEPDAKEVIDLSGKYVLPGLIDAHVHFEDPGHTDREDMEHATAACAVGGVTTVIAMPTNDPLIFTLDAYNKNIACYENRGYVDYAIHGGLDANSLPHARELWRETGITAIKVFMCYSSPNMGYVNDQALFETLELARDEGATVIIHCENDEIIKLMEKRAHEAGRTDRLSFNQSRPQFVEVEAIHRALTFAKELGAKVVVPHVSSAEGLREIRRFKEMGVEVYAESCPQYFTFTVDDFVEKGPFLRFTPVMRGQENLEEMWELMGKGYVDTIGSDHSPYNIAEKNAGLDNIWKSPNGIPGIEVELAVFLNGVNAGKLTLEQLVRMNSYNPARIFNLPGKGLIAAGYDADITVVDMDLEKAYSEADIQSKATWSPYLGKTLKGWPVMTLVRGEVVAKDGKLTGQKGHGKLVHRKK